MGAVHQLWMGAVVAIFDSSANTWESPATMVIFEGKSCSSIEGKSCSSIEVLKTMNYIDYGEERYLRRHICSRDYVQ
jgi:hypothetical protein